MKEVINIINQLRNESSINGKIKILKDNKDNELLKKVLEYTYNPFKKYGVTEKVLIPTNEEFNNIELFQLLDLLSNSNINDSLRKTVNSFLGSIQFKEERDLYVCMLLKDLKIGCNSKTINKVWKDLIPSFNVMLADKYFEKQQKVKGKEFIITQKVDGSRFVLIKDNLGNVKCYTRQGQEVNGLIEFENDFKLIPNNTVIDGEVLLNKQGLHSKDLYRETMKEFRKKGEKHGLILNAFDILTFDEFKEGKSKTKCKERKQQLHDLINNNNFTNIIEVPIRYIGKDENMIIKLLDEAVNNDEEGVMVNLADAVYECKRTTNILKAKLMKSCDLCIVGFEEGEGNFKGTLGATLVEYKNNIVKVGSGYQIEERNRIWANKDKLIGRIMEVQYFEESINSKTGLTSLRFPVFKDIREIGKEVSYE